MLKNERARLFEFRTQFEAGYEVGLKIIRYGPAKDG